MPDVFSRLKRSLVMARIRPKGNRATELVLARLLRRARITGWRRHAPVRIAKVGTQQRGQAKEPPGAKCARRVEIVTVRPDFVFTRAKVAIFVDGCFWHGCPKHSPPDRWLRRSTMPLKADRRGGMHVLRTGKSFWRAKLAANKMRDRKVNRALRQAGWFVVRIWEHELRNPQRCLDRIRRGLARTPSVRAARHGS